jgi:hypothetical protein
MNAQTTHNCQFCNYTSKRKFDVKRHQNSRHSKELKDLQEVNPPCDFEENVDVLIEKVDVCDQQVSAFYACQNCHKKYKHQKFLLEHEKNCNGLDKMTCPKCMKYFSSASAKCHHIKRNTCKAKSTKEARTPNIQYIESQNNITNNIDNRVINNTFVINNYGNERLDYFTEDEMFKIVRNGINTIPLYIEKKHFNKDFPENNNILYDHKTKRCKVRENNKWKDMKINGVSTKLFQDNSDILTSFCDNNKVSLCNHIKDDEIYEYIVNKLLYIRTQQDKAGYNTVINKIKELLENNKVE